MLKIALLLLISYSNALNSNSFCSLTEQVCKGYYDIYNNYKEVCEYEKCHKPYIYQCGSNNKCSKSATACIDYLDVNQLVKSTYYKTGLDGLVIAKHTYKNLQKNYTEKFKQFESRIKPCSKLVYSYEPSHVCMSGKNCYEKNRKHYKAMKKNVLTRIDCPCSTQLSYRCEKNYCALHRKACQSFKSNNITFTHKIAHCENDFILYEK